MSRITILIADDHTLVRETWVYMLNNDPRFEVIGEASSGEEAVELARSIRPDVVLMDINLPGIKGFEATHLIRKYSPGSKILAVSLHTQPAYVKKMMQNGAKGYVTKNSSSEEFFRAIIEVYHNRVYVCSEIKNILSEQVLTGDETANGLNSLSRREIEVIGLIKRGFSSKQAADSLKIAVKTVEVHRYNILKKLNLKNAAAMVNYINNSELSANC